MVEQAESVRVVGAQMAGLAPCVCAMSRSRSEPGDVFFGIAMGGPGAVEFTPLEGRIQLSGDYGFEV
jgi:hypothetical protein